ncbi:MAG: hypothetical protein IH626_01725 [Rhodospirillales bacterium]|nr:hypothetical protein [Rhodospirillales bacterium]
MKRRTPKRHGHVGSWPTTEIMAADHELAQFDQVLTTAGYIRADRTPVYRSKDGRYTLRIVWRRRIDGCSEVWTKTLRVQFVEIREEAA